MSSSSDAARPPVPQQSSRPSRQWGRGVRTPAEVESSYVPPSLHDGSSNHHQDDFVTSPSAAPRSLTTGISTLFRIKRGKRADRTDQRPQVTGHISDVVMIPNRTSSRLFCSNDDDSDDSYESRVSHASRKSQASRKARHPSDEDEEEDSDEELPEKTILRYRGFSTSVRSLFLDESLVCASMGCFGLLLSQRTEHLLQVRNERRGVGKRKKYNSSRREKSPSNIIAYALLMTLLLIATTFVIWGFGSGNRGVLQDYADGYNNDDGNANRNDAYVNGDDNNGNNNAADDDNNGDDANVNDDANRMLQNESTTSSLPTLHAFHGIFKLRDAHEHVWQPICNLVRDEWYRPETDQGRKLESSSDSDLASNIRTALILTFLVVLGVVGRRRRMRTRYALVKARAQEDHLYSTTSVERVQTSKENTYEGACSHTLCGCYPVDPLMEFTPEEEEESGKHRKHEDCVSRGFSCFLASCCGALCKCWFQCMSICALAQEAREMRVLVPPKYQRIDFITLQPFSEYQKNVNDLRRGWLGKTRGKSGLMPHIHALSRLSRYILVIFTSVLVVMLLTLLFNPRATFSWSDAVVLIATFVQSFLVLYIVHWIFHKSDLSLDAVVKFFGAGFVIAVPSAFFFEALMANMMLMAALSLYYFLEMVAGDAFDDWVDSHYRILWMLGELMNAYFVAAVTEELCKYYTFRTVEHPDLIFLTGLDRNAHDENAVDGGLIKYPFGAHQVSNLNRSNSFASDYSHRSNNRPSRQQRLVPDHVDNPIDRTTTEEEFAEDENDVRTYRQRAAAVTTGMISVAVGLACAENFLYVFIFGSTKSDGDGHDGGGVLEEWMVLFFRSIFPIHALAAAMQSINMIRKFVECTEDNNHRIGVGRIILPAVLLHGSFDGVLMIINVYVESAWETYDGDGQPYNVIVLNVVAWLSIFFIMFVGILWYYRENRNQRLRLILMEERDKAKDVSGDHHYSNSVKVPVSDLPGEIELV